MYNTILFWSTGATFIYLGINVLFLQFYVCLLSVTFIIILSLCNKSWHFSLILTVIAGLVRPLSALLHLLVCTKLLIMLVKMKICIHLHFACTADTDNEYNTTNTINLGITQSIFILMTPNVLYISPVWQKSKTPKVETYISWNRNSKYAFWHIHHLCQNFKEIQFLCYITF